MNSEVESMAAEFAENLRKPEDYLVQGRQYVFQAAIWAAQETCLAGDEDGIILWIATSVGRRVALQAAVRERESEVQNGRIQVSSPEILEQHLAADRSTFIQMMNRCRRIVVWLEPRDFADNSIVYWWFVWQAVKRICAVSVLYLCPWKLDEAELQCFERIHKNIRIIDAGCNCADSVWLEFADADDDVFKLSDGFWKSIYKKKVFAVCMHDENRIKYAETSHRAHVPVCFADKKIKRDYNDGFQYIDRYAALCVPDEMSFDKVVTIDPIVPLGDEIPLLAGWNAKKSNIQVIATSRASVLYTIAGVKPERMHELPDADLYMSTYQLFSGLMRDHYIEASDVDAYTKKFGTAVFNYWIQNGWIDDKYTITRAGLNLFTEIQHFSQLGVLHGFHHETVAETAGHEFRFDLDTTFFRNIASMRFVLGSHVWQRKFHHILKSHAVLMPDTSHHGNGWLDRLPVWVSQAYMQQISNYIKGSVLPEQIKLSCSAEHVLNQIRSDFKDTPERWMEVFNGEALWWTFGGGEWNRMIADLLHILAPKLEISYGNFNLLLRWHRSGNDVQPEIQRLKMLVEQIADLKIDFSNSRIISLYEVWKRNHLYYWLFRLLPDSCIKVEFNQILSRFLMWFKEKTIPVMEVDNFHQIDKLPISFEPLCPIEKKSANNTDIRWMSELVSNNNPVQRKLYTLTSENHNTPVIQGVMHTRLPWTYIDTDVGLQRAIDVILKQDYIGLDVETTLFDQTLCLVQIGCRDQSFIIDPLCVDISGLAQAFSHPDIIKIIHNASFECKVLGKCGIQIHNIVDTMKVSRKLHGMNAPGGHSLKAVCRREFGLDMDKTNQKSRWEKRPLSDSQLEYAALDAEILIHLYRKYFEHV